MMVIDRSFATAAAALPRLIRTNVPSGRGVLVDEIAVGRTLLRGEILWRYWHLVAVGDRRKTTWRQRACLSSRVAPIRCSPPVFIEGGFDVVVTNRVHRRGVPSLIISLLPRRVKDHVNLGASVPVRFLTWTQFRLLRNFQNDSIMRAHAGAFERLGVSHDI